MGKDASQEDDEEEVNVCPMCLGTGEVTTEEYVYPGEPHTAPIGTRKCLCQLPDPDDYQEEDR
jgi:hypothetical protein